MQSIRAENDLERLLKVFWDGGMKFWRLLPQNSVKERLEQLFVNKRLVVVDRGVTVFKPTIARVYRTEYGFHIIIGLYPGLSLDSVMSIYPELCYAVQGECKVWMDNSGWVHIKAYTKGLPARFKYQAEIAERVKKHPLALPIGISRQGVEIIKLYQGETYGMLIAGMPRWGKSAWFRQALTSVVTTYSEDRVWLYLIDMKGGLEFERFQRCPHTKGWAGDTGGVSKVLDAVKFEISKRIAIFKKARVTSVLEYNALGGGYLPHMILAIDEYAVLTKEHKSDIHDICITGSFAGVHPLICVQRPTADAMPGPTKAMLPVVLCFKTQNQNNSRWVLGDKITIAAHIKDKGRAVYLNGHPRMVQVMWLEPGECEAILRKKYPQRELRLVRELVP